MPTEPRTWSLPPEPEVGTTVRTAEGLELTRDRHGWKGKLGAATSYSMDWPGALCDGPLTEVLDETAHLKAENEALRARLARITDPDDALVGYGERSLIMSTTRATT